MAIDREYVSEFTQFMNGFLDKNPEVKQSQQANRATWWDREIDRDLYRRFSESREKQKPYVYQPD
ncbi:hypothetical protein HNQ59_003431 [Chitinivorax tropicus]|uniref:DUF3460 family protein n=1 Tax=Chitinivorax tropicus TaxID=714531 RepID=A0A840MSH3_9PROT|nr:DUF3460 family protein [Chitinivorax tropicus]MBB5020117.1 hypothetical protein [Chitinivorax tropicus]